MYAFTKILSRNEIKDNEKPLSANSDRNVRRGKKYQEKLKSALSRKKKMNEFTKIDEKTAVSDIMEEAN